MRPTVTPQQLSFFTQNGYIEFEIPFDSEKIFASLQKGLASRFRTGYGNQSERSAEQRYAAGRDLWRSETPLQTLLLRKLSPIVQALAGKQQLRLACDQWIPSDYRWEKPGILKDLFSIQGLVMGALFCNAAAPTPLRGALGLLPLPSQPGSVLFFKPSLILDWPQLPRSPAIDLYMAAYAASNSLYIHNPKDPSTNGLKQFGYAFGDLLKNEFHPLLIP